MPLMYTGTFHLSSKAIKTAKPWKKYSNPEISSIQAPVYWRSPVPISMTVIANMGNQTSCSGSFQVEYLPQGKVPLQYPLIRLLLVAILIQTVITSAEASKPGSRAGIAFLMPLVTSCKVYPTSGGRPASLDV